jgi:hypothetical protein
LINKVEKTIKGSITIVYDGCRSGSFLAGMRALAYQKRIMITSSSAKEPAQFMALGTVSFSYYFWTGIFNGLNVQEAFEAARDAIALTAPAQHALLDDTGDGFSGRRDGKLAQTVYIGNGSVNAASPPEVKGLSQSADREGSATISADVTAAEGLSRVWAIIVPPNFKQSNANSPVSDLPSVELVGQPASDRFEATSNTFTTPGRYEVTVCALDSRLNTSVSDRLSITVEGGGSKKAVLVAGSGRKASRTASIAAAAGTAYTALRFQGYRDDDIYYLAQEAAGPGIDAKATQENLAYALTTWAADATRDVVVCLIGSGDASGYFIDDTQSVSAAGIAENLAALQQGSLAGPVLLICDSDSAGSFLPALKPPAGKSRIVIAGSSPDQSASFSSGGISFSRFFWSAMANGATVRSAFTSASDAVGGLSSAQTPLLDDNRNGIGNEYEDGRLAQQYRIGQGVMLAANEPVIGAVQCPELLTGKSSLLIMADNVTSASPIKSVAAVITAPGPGAQAAEKIMIPVGFNHYAGFLTGLNTLGYYRVAVYAQDMLGTMSLPVTKRIYVQQ